MNYKLLALRRNTKSLRLSTLRKNHISTTSLSKHANRQALTKRNSTSVAILLRKSNTITTQKSTSKI
jgi:hypothetical protein